VSRRPTLSLRAGALPPVAPTSGIRPADAALLAELDDLSRLLDSQWRIPGIGIRIGVDAIAGLIPGLGDLATGAVSAYIVLKVARLGVPSHVIARMVGNVVLDTAVGSIPLLGSVFDVFFRANNRNIRLLRRHLERVRSARSAA